MDNRKRFEAECKASRVAGDVAASEALDFIGTKRGKKAVKESLKKVKVSVVVQSSEQLAGSGCAAVQVAIARRLVTQPM